MNFIDNINKYFLFIKLAVNVFVNNYIIPKKWYIIEGNIGCGKTTLIRNLKQSGDFEVIEEPVEEWKDIKNEDGDNILGLFYKDGNKYAYLFQTIVFKSRIRSLEIQQNKCIRFSERSIWTDKNIFSKNCFEMGLLNTVEKNTYDYWFNWLESKIKRMPDGIIYLRAPPETCHERMKKRDRVEETSVSIDYLTMIHQKHEEWLNNGITNYKGVPIYIIENCVKPNESLKHVLRIIKSNNKFTIKTIPNKLKSFFTNSFICFSYLYKFIIREEINDKLNDEFNRINLSYKCLIYNIWLIDIPLFIDYLLFL